MSLEPISVPKKEYERDVEKYLCDEVQKRGGLCLKWRSPNNRGVPDRILLFPDKILFVEVKTATGELSPMQERQGEKFKALGFPIDVVYGKSGVDLLLQRHV